MDRYRAASLDSYRRDLSGVVPLDPATERALAIRYRAGDAVAGAQLIEASLPFVIRIAREYRRWGIPMEDLIQQGNLGLLKAAGKYDPGQDCRLVTYAVFWIRAEIREFVVRGYRIVRLGSTRTERRAMRTFRQKDVESAEQLATVSGMPLKRAQQLWPILTQRDFALDANGPDATPAVDRVRDGGESPEEALSRSETIHGVRSKLQEALGRLSDRERRIVESRLLTEEPCTLEALGSEMGVSKERVRQLEARAHGKLRCALSAYHPAAA